jgi:hypothetical protein
MEMIVSKDLALQPLTSDLRRFCSLLNITPIFMIHTIMKSLISKGENEVYSTIHYINITINLIINIIDGYECCKSLKY